VEKAVESGEKRKFMSFQPTLDSPNEHEGA
jgi:hypothetical protein